MGTRREWHHRSIFIRICCCGIIHLHVIFATLSSVRLLALMGGIAMTVTSALGVWNRFLGLNWISAIVEFYTFILGLSVVILEAKSAKCRILPESWTTAWEARIRKYALFLSFVSGRGGLYFVAGTLQLSQVGWSGECFTLSSFYMNMTCPINLFTLHGLLRKKSIFQPSAI